MRLSIFIWTASLLGLAYSEEEFGEFEDKVSILIKKLMDSKYLMSENESTLLKERLAKFDRVFNKSDNISVEVSSQNPSVNNSQTEAELSSSIAAPSSGKIVTPVVNEVLLTKVKLTKENDDEVQYGNMGCQSSKRGILN